MFIRYLRKPALIGHNSLVPVRRVHYLDRELLERHLETIRSCTNEATRLSILTTHVVPRREMVSTALSSIDGCLMLAMQLRDDIAKLLTNRTTTMTYQLNVLRDTDVILREWLRTAFNADCLSIKRITYDGSSGSVLENIARGESGTTFLLFCLLYPNPILQLSFSYAYPNPNLRLSVSSTYCDPILICIFPSLLLVVPQS